MGPDSLSSKNSSLDQLFADCAGIESTSQTDALEGSLYYYDSEGNNTASTFKKINPEDIESSPEKMNNFLELCRNKLIVLIKNVDGNKKDIALDPKADPKFIKQLKNATTINIEDEKGKRTKVSKKDLVIRKQTKREMAAIAVVVNDIALRVLLENKKQEKEEKQSRSEHEPARSDPIDQKLPKAALIDRKDDSSLNKAEKCALNSLKKSSVEKKHREEDKETKKLQEEILLHHWIVVKDTSKHEIKNEDLVKAIRLISQILKKMVPLTINQISTNVDGITVDNFDEVGGKRYLYNEKLYKDGQKSSGIRY